MQSQLEDIVDSPMVEQGSSRPHSIVDNVLGCDIIGNKFELQLHY